MTACLVGLAAGLLATSVSIYQAVVTDPLPAADPRRLVALGGLAYGEGMPDAAGWWSRADGIEHLARYECGNAEFVAEGVATRWVRVTELSGDFFGNFSGAILLGRGITRADELANLPVAVLSESLWKDLGNGRDLSEQPKVSVGGVSVTVVGVAGQVFSFPSATQVWVVKARVEAARPTTVDGAPGLPPIRTRGGWIATLKPGVTHAQLEEQLLVLLQEANDILGPRTGMRYGDSVGVRSLIDALTQNVKQALWTVVVASVVLLALCYFNLGILISGRALASAQNIAIRRGLGAPTAALLRDSLADAAMLVVASGGLSVAAFVGLIAVARHLLHAYLVFVPPTETLLWRYASFVLASSVLVAFSSVVPDIWVLRVVRAWKPNGSGGRIGGDGRVHTVTRRLFVIAASGAATVFLWGALVTGSALLKSVRVDLGYSVDQILFENIAFQRRMVDGPAFATTRRALLDAAASAGLSPVAIGRVPVLATQRGYTHMSAGQNDAMVAVLEVDGDYFGVLGVRPLWGSSEPIGDGIVIGAALASRLFPDTGVLGQRVRANSRDYVVTGVVPDIKTADQGDKLDFQAYRSFDPIDGTKMPTASVSLHLIGRCRTSCAALYGPLLNHTRPFAAAGATVLRLSELRTEVDAARGRETVAAGVWSVFAALASGIAVLGVASMTVRSVAARRFEIGVKSALGAPTIRLIFTLVREGVASVSAGLVLGFALAFNASRIRGVTVSTPPMTLGEVTVISVTLLLCACIACAAPALSATRRSAVFLLRGNGG